MRSIRTTRALGALLAALVLTAGSITTASATQPTEDPVTAAEYGAHWLATQVQPDGSVPGGFDPLADAGNAALAFAAAGVGGDAFERTVAHVEANIETFVAYPFDPTIDDPARLGKAIMIAVVAGEDPTSFGGTNLVARLQATFGLFAPGLYGANDPSFDGVFRQGLAMTGLLAAGVNPPAAAAQWLVDQQCGPATPASEGGWQAYRANLAVPCSPPDPNTFTGPDSNSTALAVMALEAVGVTPAEDAIAHIESTQEADGGWAFIPGSGTDPSSTSLVVRALLAAGESPGTEAWDSLLSWQQGCDAAEADRGAFTSSFSDPPGTPDLFSTIDGVTGAAGVPYPVPGPASLVPTAPEVDCTPDDPADPDQDPTAGPTGPSSPARPASVAGATPVATAVSATPAVTG